MIVVVGSNIGKEKKVQHGSNPVHTFGFLHLAYQKNVFIHINDSTYKLLIPSPLPACWSIRHNLNTEGHVHRRKHTRSRSRTLSVEDQILQMLVAPGRRLQPPWPGGVLASAMD